MTGLGRILGLRGKDFINDSYSQEGEDLILKRVFRDKKEGFFIDVGAYHPKRFSTTYRFYMRGWRGINIDAMPGSMAAFKASRPLDTNLEIAVSDRNEVIPFYIFNEPALNTFCADLADKRNGQSGYKIQKVVHIETCDFARLLEEYLPGGTTIDFLNIDAEGFEPRILAAFNWKRYKPSMVLVESELLFSDVLRSETYAFMLDNGYELFAKLFRTVVFKSLSFNG